MLTEFVRRTCFPFLGWKGVKATLMDAKDVYIKFAHFQKQQSKYFASLYKVETGSINVTMKLVQVFSVLKTGTK